MLTLQRTIEACSFAIPMPLTAARIVVLLNIVARDASDATFHLSFPGLPTSPIHRRSWLIVESSLVMRRDFDYPQKWQNTFAFLQYSRRTEPSTSVLHCNILKPS
jgi:hypothetical protein